MWSFWWTFPTFEYQRVSSRLSTYWPTKWLNEWRWSQHTTAGQTPGLKSKTRGVKSGRSSGLKPGRLGLSYKANKCSDTGTGDLGVLPTHIRKWQLYWTGWKSLVSSHRTATWSSRLVILHMLGYVTIIYTQTGRRYKVHSQQRWKRVLRLQWNGIIIIPLYYNDFNLKLSVSNFDFILP